jgi:hypothetical protein
MQAVPQDYSVEGAYLSSRPHYQKSKEKESDKLTTFATLTTRPISAEQQGQRRLP